MHHTLAGLWLVLRPTSWYNYAEIYIRPKYYDYCGQLTYYNYLHSETEIEITDISLFYLVFQFRFFVFFRFSVFFKKPVFPCLQWRNFGISVDGHV
jgi:hypothetical protein